jgi:hypothetical protein
MLRLLAVAALAAAAAAAPVPDTQTYKLKLKKEATGDKAAVTSTEAADIKVVLDIGGNKLNEGDKETTREEYTEEVLERPDGAKKATRLKRTYKVAGKTKGDETTDFAYQGKTVLIEKKGDKYVFTVDGKELDEDDAGELDEEFNKEQDIPLENEDFLPEKAVKVGETWTVDADKVVKGFEAGAPFTLHKDKTAVTGKLVKVYDKGGRQYGVIELTLKLGVKELKLSGEEIPLKAGSTIAGTITLDVCIDGSSHSGSEKGDLKFDLTGEVPNGTIAVKGTVKMSQTVEDLKAK